MTLECRCQLSSMRSLVAPQLLLERDTLQGEPRLDAQSACRAAKRRTEADADADAEASPMASAQAWLRVAEQGAKASAAARAPLVRTPSNPTLLSAGGALLLRGLSSPLMPSCWAQASALSLLYATQLSNARFAPQS